MDIMEIFGLAASVIVAIALTQKSVLRLRIINLVGSICFVIYGASIGSIPVVALNSFTCLTNLFYLRRMMHPLDRLDILTPEKGELTFITHFINFHREDILHFNPQLNTEELLKDKDCHFFPILRNGQPVSLVICRQTDETNWQVLLDYATPDFRDLKCGRYFYASLKEILTNFGEDSVQSVSAETANQTHVKYLKKIGFSEEKPGLFKMPVT
ncbi:MAG: YgjV family protein [Spirochaetales bacterium]|nr:YgjV family protein [Spirochaetales bacterium]